MILDVDCPCCNRRLLALQCNECKKIKLVSPLKMIEQKAARSWFAERRELCSDCLAKQAPIPPRRPELVSLPPKTRAGTPLSHGSIPLVFYDAEKARRKGGDGETTHGSVDLKKRFYQACGQVNDFILRKKSWVTMPEPIWTQLITTYLDKIDYIEWYDREEDRAWLIDFEEARSNFQRYDLGIGPRIGIPMDLFVCVDERLPA